MIDGEVAPGFEAVRTAFAQNFERFDEVGAAFAVTLDGVPVVDLWGGLADRESGRPWTASTMPVIFSGTKGLAALCVLMLVDRGVIDLEAPVARYWPEFAAEGKGAVTVAELASHRGRLPGIREKVRHDDITDDRAIAARLAAQPQETDPRAADAYHAFTYGWLCGELVRRADGRSVGRFFAEEVAGPLGLDLFIGLPPEREPDVATMAYTPSWGGYAQWDGESMQSDELLGRVWNNPQMFPMKWVPWNRPDWHAAEIPGAGGIGTARSVARLYGCLARGGEVDGVRLLSEESLQRGRTELTRRWEPMLNEPMAFGVGFQLQTDLRVFGPPPEAFGHPGAGGSVHCAWPLQRVGISYAMSAMRDDRPVDPRPQALMWAVHHAVTSA
ncbi:beta-lactamase family protein [Baekduia soli]|uniref:Beta-lactamase family protein n=2 Tax=Baekduia soli TaxID=496014 RepID=A0A5B8UCB7_9ACTN|nr:beta-lactamase family protein [Baekduia soli]